MSSLSFSVDDAERMTYASTALAVLLLSARAGIKHTELRSDLRGAALTLLGVPALRVVRWGLVDGMGRVGPSRYLDALCELLLAVGLVRVGVGALQWLLRGRKGVFTPKIVRDTVDLVLYSVCAVVIAHQSLQIELGSLLATSAALSVVAGFALQETLGNVLAGLSLQVEHPFQVGDWVGINEFTGRVTQMAWRATKLETVRGEQVSIPNGTIAKANVLNYSTKAEVGREVKIGLAYKCPPERVKRVILDVLRETPGVQHEPAPSARLTSYDDSQMTYTVKFFVLGFEPAVEDVTDRVLSTLWYRFKREGLDIPFPQRVVELRQVPAERLLAEAAREKADTAALLSKVDFLRPLGDAGILDLAERVQRLDYGSGEAVIRAGDQGETFYLVAVGEVAVVARVGDRDQEVARLRPGQFFGEMSLLTGEPRTATVTAAGEATLIGMSRSAFAAALASHPGIAQELADILGRRKGELDRAKAGGDSTSNLARAESKRIFSRLRELFTLGGA
jgi:small-conductance mechanosensitive channel/CRP-like cAMP-binding protein